MICFSIASGWTLTPEDTALIRQWRRPGRVVVAVNRAFELAHWADHFVGIDQTFWREYGQYIRAFGGQMWSGTHKVPYTKRLPSRRNNSGAAAIHLAEHLGAEKIYLIGYDLCYSPTGRRHFHDDYPKGMGNAGSLKSWLPYFNKMNVSAEVINCTRGGVLERWPRMALEDVVNEQIP